MKTDTAPWTAKRITYFVLAVIGVVGLVIGLAVMVYSYHLGSGPHPSSEGEPGGLDGLISAIYFVLALGILIISSPIALTFGILYRRLTVRLRQQAALAAPAGGAGQPVPLASTPVVSPEPGTPVEPDQPN